jgi:hypothetical protein
MRHRRRAPHQGLLLGSRMEAVLERAPHAVDAARSRCGGLAAVGGQWGTSVLCAGNARAGP